MTCARHGRRPVVSAMRRGIGLAVTAGLLAFAGTMALAQQSWDATVSVEAPAPKPAPFPWASVIKAIQAKPPPATVVPDEKVPPASAQVDAKALPKVAPKGRLETGSIKGPPADDYCSSITSAAADARFAWQKKTIADLEQELAKRVAALEEKTAEYQKWLARRDEFSKKANETLLQIYSRMRPDAAAAQLASLDEETAASVLVKLEPRRASLILNEMETTQAVRLTATISGAGKIAPAAPPKTAEAKTK